MIPFPHNLPGSSRLASIAAIVLAAIGVAASSRAELHAFYSFDDPADPLADSSGNNRDLTGTAGTNPGWGSATGFNGTGAYDFSGDRLIAPIDVNPAAMPDMTWGAWVRTDDLTSGLRKVIGQDNGGWDRTLGLDDRNGASRYTAFTGFGPPVAGTPGPVSTADWTFLAASHDSSAGTVTVYIDLDASTTDDPLSVVSAAANYGSGWNTFAIGGIRPDSNSEAWDGAIDNVFVYDEALDLAAVTALRDAFGPPRAPVINSFSASPGFISSGASTTLSWDVRDADSLAIDMGAPAVSGANGSVMVSPGATTTYTLTATNGHGQASAQVTVGVDIDALPPQLTEFVAVPDGTFPDGDGGNSDWIELSNANPFPFDLAGFRLVDSANTWIFPAGAQIEAGGYLIVFASGQPLPDYVDDGGYLHTTFGMSSAGEELRLIAPDGVTVVSELLGAGAQQSGVSWGRDPASGQAGYMAPPTPAGPNGAAFAGRVQDTNFDVDRGFYDAPFTVTITSDTPGASIAYTRDGSEPGPGHGTIVPPADAGATGLATVEVLRTTVLRAMAFKDGMLPTNTDTQTYIFLAHVVRQRASQPGFPTTWGLFTGINGGTAGAPVPADYEMKQEIVSADPEGMIDALRSLPSMSIVADPDDLFFNEGILPNPFGSVNGIGVYTHNPFVANRRCSMEWIDPDGAGPEVQVDCGIRLSGGWSRHYIATPKKSFSLLFQREFGEAKLNFPLFGEGEIDEFDRIVLKAIFSNAWVDAAVRPDYLRDLMLRETQLAMGQPSSRGTWVHLYLNGLYWGIYNPTERCDANYAASHFPGGEDDFDAIKHAGLCAPGCAQTNQFELIDGTPDAWHTAQTIAGNDLSNPARYAQFHQYVDVTNLADYIILNTYCANSDWPGKNWYAFRRRAPGEGYKFVSWDAEYALENVNTNRVNVSGSNNPALLYDRARQSPEFRLLFADRVHKHVFNGGALDPGVMHARYSALAAVIEPAMDAEAARWGDNPNTRMGARDYRKSHWLNARDHILNNFIPNRRPVAMSQYRAAGLYPLVEAPEFNQHGGSLPNGFTLTLASPSAGTIYYTTNGADPRLSTNLEDNSAVLVGEDAPKRAIMAAAPGEEPPGGWNALGFDASSWNAGTQGAGYEASAGGRYDPLVDPAFDFGAQASPAGHETIYLRAEFQVADPGAFDQLTLKVRHDDGFVAYLNGHEVARANAPGTPGDPLPWDAEADADHLDDEAELFLDFDASSGLPHLQAGSNVLAIHALNRGEGSSDFLIWPTLEGAIGGTGLHPSAIVYSGQVQLAGGSVVKARLLSPSGEWSALTEASFTVGTVAATAANLAISKIHYHPAAPTAAEIAAGHGESSDFEYLELINYGPQPITLSGLRFVDGIDFTFSAASIAELAPGERGLLVSNLVAFTARYGGGFRILGEFESGNLSNDGEQLALIDENGADLWRFTYNDAGAWPDSPDGFGPALALLHPASPPDNAGMSLPENWRPSGQPDGAPGPDGLALASWLAAQPDPDPLADSNHDGINQLLAFATGALDAVLASSYLPAVSVVPLEVGGMTDFYPVIDVHELIGAEGIRSSMEISTDLNIWQTAALVLVWTADQHDGTVIRRYRTAAPFDPEITPRMFLRLVVEPTN